MPRLEVWTASRILTAADQPDINLVWAGTITTELTLPDLQANLSIFGSGSVGGYLSIFGSGSVGGDLRIVGSVGGDLRIVGSVGGDLRIVGSVGGDLRIDGSVDGSCVLTPSKMLSLGSVRGARFGREVHVGDRVSIDTCDFRQCPDLDKLLLVGTDLFPNPRPFRGPRLAMPDGATHAEMASVYRRLRTNLEGRSNRPGAAIFYRGKMRSRFWSAVDERQPVEAIVIGLYWLMSGFGLNPWRPVVFFVVLAAMAAQGFIADNALGGIEVGSAPGLEGWWDAFQFSVRSIVSFVSPPTPPAGGALDRDELWLQLLLRFFGPLLFAQFVLAVRDRVAR